MASIKQAFDRARRRPNRFQTDDSVQSGQLGGEAQPQDRAARRSCVSTTALEAHMNRKTLPLSALLLALALASCAPTVQGPMGVGTYQPNVRYGIARTLTPAVQLADFTDATPDTAYIHLPECGNAEVLAADVRKLSVDVAREACTKTEQNILTGGVVGGTLLTVLFVGWLVALQNLGQDLGKAFGQVKSF